MAGSVNRRTIKVVYRPPGFQKDCETIGGTKMRPHNGMFLQIRFGRHSRTMPKQYFNDTPNDHFGSTWLRGPILWSSCIWGIGSSADSVTSSELIGISSIIIYICLLILSDIFKNSSKTYR